MSITGDTDVRRRIVDDLDDGFTLLVERYQGGIYSGALRLTRSREDARDVAQDTFLRAYRALGTYDRQRIETLAVKPWLWTITLNLCRSRAKRAKPTRLLAQRESLSTNDAPHFDEREWNLRLAALSNPQRTAVVLRHVGDLSIGEIASITGRPEGTIKTDISRGLSKLRTIMEEEESV
ncbi:MAG: RNA polymerase sigma factor [Actinomycetia bacterium]|nr:RNA polymerase sigma factor [Actinomycetes bacterium]